MNKVKPIRLSLQTVDALRDLKESSFWPAIREWMAVYVKLQKDLAFHLSETDPTFPVRHSRYTSKVAAFNDFINFVERVVKKEEDKKEKKHGKLFG